jgi:hypothetical protein
MPGKVILRASVRGARRKGYDLRRAGRRVQSSLLDEFAGRLAPESTRTVRAYAPHRSGRLERGLQGRVRSYGGRISIEITSTARSDAGYDYLPVTRFGHRKAIITPVHARALKIQTPEGVIFRKSVRGYRPDHDWVESAFRDLEDELDRAAERIGRTIDRSLR